MDLYSRPYYTVKALRTLATLPAPTACYEERVAADATDTALSLETPVDTAPTTTPATARVPTSMKTTAPVATAASSPATAPASVKTIAPAPARPAAPEIRPADAQPTAARTGTLSTSPTASTDAFGPVRTLEAPVKSGRAYDWTALP